MVAACYDKIGNDAIVSGILKWKSDVFYPRIGQLTGISFGGREGREGKGRKGREGRKEGKEGRKGARSHTQLYLVKWHP